MTSIRWVVDCRRKSSGVSIRHRLRAMSTDSRRIRWSKGKIGAERVSVSVSVSVTLDHATRSGRR